MKFKRKWNGYDPQEVDQFLQGQYQKNEEILAEQKSRIFHLTEENYQLLEKVEKYKQQEEAIVRALVDSQKQALRYQSDAEKFSAYNLQRAKIFVATWQTYAKLIVDHFSAQQIKDFNDLSKKIEQLIVSYSGEEVASTVAQTELSEKDFQTKYQNPIEKVQKALADQPVVDLMELQKPQQSLDEICKELGLIE